MKAAIVLLMLAFLMPSYSFAQDDVVNAKIQQLAKELADGIRTKGKTRVGITTLTDLQDYPTELGKYLAVKLQGYLVNNNLRVINRTQLDKLLEENRLTAKGLLNPDSALKLQKATGMEVVVIGTLAPSVKSVDINVLALDLQGAEAIASAETAVPRTESIDAMLRTTVRQESTEKSKPLRENEEKDLSKSECEKQGYFYGKYCFENRFNEPLLLYKCEYGFTEDTNILIAAGSVSCSPLLNLVYSPSHETKFYFRTINEPVKEGFITLTVQKCKSKFVALTPQNFYLKRPE